MKKKLLPKSIRIGSVHAHPMLVRDPQRFLDGNTQIGIGELLRKGCSLREIRALRKSNWIRRSADASVPAFPGYDEFVEEMDRAARPLLEVLPVRVVTRRSSFAGRFREVVLVHGADMTAGEVIHSTRPTWAVSRALDLLASEFADDLASVLGDGDQVRLFAYRGQVYAGKFHDTANERNAKLASFSDVRAELTDIAETSSILFDLILKATESRALIERSHNLRRRLKPDRIVIEEAAWGHKGESDLAYQTRTSELDWNALRCLVHALWIDADHARNRIKVARGRVKNEHHAYTPLSLIADAWLSSFGKEPSSADRSRFSKIAHYAMLLFSRSRIDIKGGLKYWKDTRKLVSSKQRMSGVNPLAIGP